MRKNIFTEPYKPMTSDEALEKVKEDLDKEAKRDKIKFIIQLIEGIIAIAFWVGIIHWIKH